MAYEFKRLSEVEKLEEIPETATVYVEVNGETKRVAKDLVGVSKGGGSLFVDVTMIGESFNGTDQNYDPIYEALLEGQTVYVRINIPDYGRTVVCNVLMWQIWPGEGFQLCIWGNNEPMYLGFTNGSYHGSGGGVS